ncbi:CYTH domain protein [Planctomycetes bacterium Pan216]|uniref:CYTH domain protein n=1 Tax=Kolteria novifilia TaxID=2527975 RepID=A0A518B5U3_9BACT|nr:CYTH domain protein [Planctomycetes bacterium Pan216]
MNYEVELKFHVTDVAGLRAKLEKLGAKEIKSKRQIDRYFNHPCRDFAETDEAVRVRVDGEHNRVTYKGPKIDSATKTRREIEVTLAPGESSRDDFAALLLEVGFRDVISVAKTRVVLDMVWKELTLEIALDDVDGLGSFLEIEAQADDQSLDDARRKVLELAETLGYTDVERRSYLQMLLLAQS